MPKEMERKLKAIAAARGYSGKRAGAFIYGTMRKTGWKPSRETVANAAGRLVRKHLGSKKHARELRTGSKRGPI